MSGYQIFCIIIAILLFLWWVWDFISVLFQMRISKKKLISKSQPYKPTIKDVDGVVMRSKPAWGINSDDEKEKLNE